MMEFAIHLEACDPARNIWRSYSITAGQDLFGDWIVAMNYGRIGSRGTTKRVLLSDEAEIAVMCKNALKSEKMRPNASELTIK